MSWLGESRASGGWMVVVLVTKTGNESNGHRQSNSHGAGDRDIVNDSSDGRKAPSHWNHSWKN